jgi:hypothetical protein
MEGLPLGALLQVEHLGSVAPHAQALIRMTLRSASSAMPKLSPVTMKMMLSAVGGI